jgi:DivIVA domain-containing protein
MARRKKKRGVEEAGFGEEQVDASERQRLAPVDVQQKVFRLAFRGYNEGDVDQFLDDVTETLAALHEENKRLREQLQEGGGTPTGATAAAQRQAEAIVRQAREEAARIAGGAEGGQEVGAGVAGMAPPSFLVRERAFLQQIASLVQDHARSLKDEARRLREAPAAASEPGELGTAATAGVAGVAAGAGVTGAEASQPAEGEPTEEAGTGDEDRSAEAAVEEAPAATAAEEGPAGDAGTSPDPAAVAGADEVLRPEEATAPWRPAEQQSPEGPGWPGSSPDDPLVSAWESAFASTSEGGTAEEEEPDESSADSQGSDERDKREEPSLRELFWGEE